MEKNFTEQDSLKLINEMIAQAKNNIQKGAGNSIIYWGYVVATTAIINFILLHVLEPSYNAFHIWWLMIPASIVSSIIERKRDRKAIVTTHIDKIITSIWIGFSISIVITLISIFGVIYVLNLWNIALLITPTLLILTGLAQFGTAVACRYKPYYYAAYIFWAGALLCILSLALFHRGDLQFIILALCMITGFCIPGHVLNSKAKENV